MYLVLYLSTLLIYLVYTYYLGSVYFAARCGYSLTPVPYQYLFPGVNRPLDEVPNLR